MKKLKYEILFTILFMTVGIAAVSSNIIFSGSTQLASNSDDFLVYFSDVLVNGEQALSLVQNETSLVFTGEFSAVGDKKEITYDVTNASMNYDADIDITCTQSTAYLTITNSFDTDSYLSARSTRTGVLTITLSKSYIGTGITQDISCTINASAVERTTQGSGEVVAPVEKIDLITFTIDGITYQAEEWMTWREWVNSSYNPGAFAIGSCNICGEPCVYDSNGYSIISTVDPYYRVNYGMVIGSDEEVYIYEHYLLEDWQEEAGCWC